MLDLIEQNQNKKNTLTPFCSRSPTNANGASTLPGASSLAPMLRACALEQCALLDVRKATMAAGQSVVTREPPLVIEPKTFSLQDWRSATELYKAKQAG